MFNHLTPWYSEVTEGTWTPNSLTHNQKFYHWTTATIGATGVGPAWSRTQNERLTARLRPKMKWFCPSSSLCQHFYRGHFSRPGSRLLSALRTQFFFLRDSLIRFVDNLYKSLTISYLIYLLYQMFFKKSNYLILVLMVGLESTIFCLSNRCSNQLNYLRILKIVVEPNPIK